MEEKRLILSLCVEQGLLAATNGHLYNWHLVVKKQVEGLGIGSDLKIAVARLVLLNWDKRGKEHFEKFQKMRTILSFGFTHIIATKDEM